MAPELFLQFVPLSRSYSFATALCVFAFMSSLESRRWLITTLATNTSMRSQSPLVWGKTPAPTRRYITTLFATLWRFTICLNNWLIDYEAMLHSVIPADSVQFACLTNCQLTVFSKPGIKSRNKVPLKMETVSLCACSVWVSHAYLYF